MVAHQKTLDSGGIREFLLSAKGFLSLLDQRDAIMPAIKLSQAIDEIEEWARAGGSDTISAQSGSQAQIIR